MCSEALGWNHAAEQWSELADEVVLQVRAMAVFWEGAKTSQKTIAKE